MISALYLCIGVAALAVLVLGIKLYGKHRDIVFLLILAPLTLLWYDSFIIGIGGWIGEESLLKTLSWPRYIAHELLLPFWIIAAGALARRANFNWTKSKSVMAVFCLVGTAGILFGAKELLTLEIFPACLHGTLRYVPFVSEAQACRPDMVGLGHVPSGPPIIPIFSTLLFLVLGLMLWVQRKWPWLFLGTLIMFMMAGMPQSIAGPLFSNIAEPILAMAALITARRLTTHQG